VDEPYLPQCARRLRNWFPTVVYCRHILLLYEVDGGSLLTFSCQNRVPFSEDHQHRVLVSGGAQGKVLFKGASAEQEFHFQGGSSEQHTFRSIVAEGSIFRMIIRARFSFQEDH
jgi:hypothetical protein